jgi:hypothetical protein
MPFTDGVHSTSSRFDAGFGPGHARIHQQTGWDGE